MDFKQRSAELGWVIRDSSFSAAHFTRLTLGDAQCRLFPLDKVISFQSGGASRSDDLEHLLNDIVLPKLHAYAGRLVLHGGAFFWSGFVVGLIAQSGHGKSTLSASLHAAGCSLLGDDALILRHNTNGVVAERIYPSLRLLPDSLEKIFPTIKLAAPVANYTDKRRVPFDVGIESAPLRALFRLTDPGNDIRVVQLAPAAACMAIIQNAFAFDSEDADETRNRFAQAALAAQVIPVFDLTYPRDYARLPEVHTAIFATLDMLPDTPRPETTGM